jgi:hypothetical protein
VAIGFAHLTNEVVHIGVEPGAKQNRGIDISRLGMFGGLLEKVGQIAEKVRENADRRFVYRDGHDAIL